jgi:hypothetical protein
MFLLVLDGLHARENTHAPRENVKLKGKRIARARPDPQGRQKCLLLGNETGFKTLYLLSPHRF